MPEPGHRPVDPRLIEALRSTARRLDDGAHFRWTHMGACNCGHLAQTVTALSADEIHRRALERPGDWSRQAAEHGTGSGPPAARGRRPLAVDLCTATGASMERIVEVLFGLGLGRTDLRHLEHLSDRRVLARIPTARRPLDKRRRSDAVLYLRAWADDLEERWLATRELPTTLPTAPTPAAAGALDPPAPVAAARSTDPRRVSP